MDELSSVGQALSCRTVRGLRFPDGCVFEGITTSHRLVMRASASTRYRGSYRRGFVKCRVRPVCKLPSRRGPQCTKLGRSQWKGPFRGDFAQCRATRDMDSGRDRLLPCCGSPVTRCAEASEKSYAYLNEDSALEDGDRTFVLSVWDELIGDLRGFEASGALGQSVLHSSSTREEALQCALSYCSRTS